MKEYETRTAPKSKKTADTVAIAERLQKLRDHMRVYFPSEKTIDQSRGGRDVRTTYPAEQAIRQWMELTELKQNAGTIFFMSRWWDQTAFPKAVLRDCRSKRAGLLMHNKVFYVRQKSSSASSTPSGFAYVGSANMSESAW